MGFLDSIKTAFVKYVIFNGRASRSEFWYFVLFIFLIGFCSGIFAAHFKYSPYAQEFYGFFSTSFLAITFIPFVSIHARRFHDINKSAWWILLFFPYGFFLRISWFDLITFRESSVYADIFIGIIVLSIIYIATYGYWLVKKGDKSSNKYGPNPIKK